MASKICMNGACGATSSFEWRKGWRLRSGGFANLCDNCGCAYEKLVFCEAFHSKESGWRECNSCGKRLHCGCVASKDALVIPDNGGVECLHCARTSGLSSIPHDERPYKFGTSAADNVGELPSISVDNTVDGDGCHILPKPLKMGSSTGLEGNKDILPHIRVARPPAEGRVRSQLLPRYWPKITDQELQQISGDSNSTIVPLFEKVLSASDAGRIGRLVLPKACAEAYFPPISQPEGLQLKIQDVKGKDWVFQFRFWPNNNSRMYVLEGVTPCIQSMQLQAGDTVTFSRIYPEGKLVMGFRKASNSIPMQGSTDPHLSALSEHLSSADVDIGSHKNESLQLQPTLDPPPIVKPSIMVEDQEFEEYKEPPVVGKRTIFTARSSGEQDQWARCDGCSKWRRLPVDALLPPKWTCAENSWDPRWSSCSAPSEMSPKELENLLRLNMDFKKQRNMASHKSDQEQEPSGLDALATAAVLGDSGGNSGMPSVAKTTRHPRHRPGCTCIVCIQPPSGKGPKHEPTCTCNVCMTVKRRFKTLMHKKKRDSEPECEAEITQRKPQTKDEAEIDSASRGVTLNLDSSDNEARKATNSEFSCGQNQVVAEKVAESGKGQMDLAVIQTAKKTSKQGQ